jgi:SAM-dependent methyltransferase
MSTGKSANWFDDAALGVIYHRYGGKFEVKDLSYATAEDYCDSFDHLRPLATASLDLKDVQRPWMLKAILGTVPRGGKILEIGAGEPWVADILQRLGYEVWIVDPYDGSGNGPDTYDLFTAQCPNVRFIRDQFSDRLSQVADQSFDCIHSISVLEHVGRAGLMQVAGGIRKFLKPGGAGLHAIDHVHRGNGAEAHLTNLRLMAQLFDFSPADLDKLLQLAGLDTETYFLSVESHNRWRGATPYRDFPMRVCISVQMLSRVRRRG